MALATPYAVTTTTNGWLVGSDSPSPRSTETSATKMTRRKSAATTSPRFSALRIICWNSFECVRDSQVPPHFSIPATVELFNSAPALMPVSRLTKVTTWSPYGASLGFQSAWAA